MSNNAKEVVYQTKDGGTALGYIINDRTYKDPEGKVRVDVGSTVPTAGGTFTLTPYGGVKTQTSVADDISKSYSQSAGHLGAARDASIRGINAATQRTYDQIDRQRGVAQDRYEQANRQAYQAYVNASNPYGAAAEAAAKLGLSNSGYSESSKMQLANTYQQALSDNLTVRDNYLKELDNAYRDAKYQGDIDLANAIAEYEKLVYQHGINAAEAIANQQNLAFETGIEASERMWDRQTEEQVRNETNRQARDRQLWERAFALAQAGLSNQQIANTLGVSLSELNRITQK